MVGVNRGRKRGERRCVRCIFHSTSSNVAERWDRCGSSGGKAALKSNRIEDFKWRGGQKWLHGAGVTERETCLERWEGRREGRMRRQQHPLCCTKRKAEVCLSLSTWLILVRSREEDLSAWHVCCRCVLPTVYRACLHERWRYCTCVCVCVFGPLQPSVWILQRSAHHSAKSHSKGSQSNHLCKREWLGERVSEWKSGHTLGHQLQSLFVLLWVCTLSRLCGFTGSVIKKWQKKAVRKDKKKKYKKRQRRSSLLELLRMSEPFSLCLFSLLFYSCHLGMGRKHGYQELTRKTTWCRRRVWLYQGVCVCFCATCWLFPSAFKALCFCVSFGDSSLYKHRLMLM